MITSDKAINNRSFDSHEGDVLGRNLNKSYSTNNVTQKVDFRGEQPALVQSRFVPLAFGNQHIVPQSIDVFSNQNVRPIDLLIQNK